ncbi:hypothetical protein N2152v2_004539 [Parachlorella kessleri]
MDAPYLVEAADAEELQENGGDEQGRSWWRWTDVEPGTRPSRAAHYAGWEASQAAISEALQNHYPVDGLLGFSQGATAAALFLAHARGQHVLSGLMGAILIGGFLPRDATYAAALREGRPSLTSLLVSGAKDTLVPEERSQQLAETFEEGAVRFYLHPGGHMQHQLSRELASDRRPADAQGISEEELQAAQEEVAASLEPEPSQDGQEALPPPACAFLRPGQCFQGRQRVAQIGVRKNEHWGVHVTIQGCDTARGYMCGTMEASNVPEAGSTPVTTFFEGEVVDNVNHSFYTADWSACAQTDLRHWSKFEGFQALHLVRGGQADGLIGVGGGQEGGEDVVKNRGRSSQLASYPYVFMRWKERYFVKGSESRLTIAGFYYICVRRSDGQIEGLYYDPSSSPDQKLELGALAGGEAGHAFAHYELA